MTRSRNSSANVVSCASSDSRVFHSVRSFESNSDSRRERGPCATLSLPPAASSTLPVHHRVSQLKSNPTKFQYAISVRLKLKPNEQDKSLDRCLSLSLSSSWFRACPEHAPQTVCSTVVPHSTTACPSFLPWPATARPGALRLATLLRGAGLERCWWCQPGRDIWESGTR